MPGLSCELTSTWGSMNSRQSLLQNIPIRDKNVVITWVQLKLQLVLTGIFQLIITETEPSLLCCFVPSSESNQETAQPRPTHVDGGELSMSWLCYSGPIHGMPEFLMSTTAKSSADSGRLQKRGASAIPWAYSSSSNLRKRKQQPLPGKSPQWLDRSPVTRDPAFPRNKSCGRSEEIWCIIGSGEFLFPVWLPGYLIALEKSVLGKNDVISERFHHARCSWKYSQRRGGLASFSDHFHT